MTWPRKDEHLVDRDSVNEKSCRSVCVRMCVIACRVCVRCVAANFCRLERVELSECTRRRNVLMMSFFYNGIKRRFIFSVRSLRINDTKELHEY